MKAVFTTSAGCASNLGALLPRQVLQGGQSSAAIEMAASHSDWMFLNSGPHEKIERIVKEVRRRASAAGRTVRFALYSIPLCRDKTPKPT